MRLTRNFRLEEFACNDGTPVPERYIENAQRLASNLQVLRTGLNRPIKIISAYRHPRYNRKVGGGKRSQHLIAKAADIRISGMSPRQVYELIKRLIKSGRMDKGGLGFYPRRPGRKGFVHYDVRNRNARWRG